MAATQRFQVTTYYVDGPAKPWRQSERALGEHLSPPKTVDRNGHRIGDIKQHH